MRSVAIIALVLVATAGAFTPIVGHIENMPTSYTPAWVDCGYGQTPFTVINVTLSQQPSKDSTLTGTTCGSVSQSLTLATEDITITDNGKTLSKGTQNIGQNVNAGDTYCFSSSDKIPFYAPSGTYNITGVLMSSSNTEVGCVSFTFNL